MQYAMTNIPFPLCSALDDVYRFLGSTSSSSSSGSSSSSVRSCSRRGRDVWKSNPRIGVGPCQLHTIMRKNQRSGSDHVLSNLCVWIGEWCGQVTSTPPTEKRRWTWPVPQATVKGWEKRWGPMWPLPSTQCPQVLDPFPWWGKWCGQCHLAI